MVDKQQSKQIYIFKNLLYPIIKIGMSDNPLKRLTTIECACGFPLEVVYESKPITRPQVTEKLIHKQLDSFRTKGEWFNISIEEAIKVINIAVENANSGEYKDLIKDFQLTRDCVETYDYVIKQSINNLTNEPHFKEAEEYIYVDAYYNYYMIYFQGELKRSVKFCNYHLAKKFKKEHLNRLIKLQ